MLRTSTAIALIAALGVSPALAATWTFEQLDADSNLEVTDTEFEALSAGAITSWDSDGDGLLSAAEFEMHHPELGVDVADPIAEWDTTSDGMLDATEFGDGLYDFFDADDNDVLESHEFEGMEIAGVEQAGGIAGTVAVEEIIELPEWSYDPLYSDGVSAERLIGHDVLGPAGDDIGQVENILISPDGRAVAIIAELGGLWEIGDTHVSIPWDAVEITPEGAIVPVTEDTADDYSIFQDDYLMLRDAATQIQEVGGDGWGEIITGPRVWRATELIGDYARLQDGGQFAEYGMVDDIIIRDGQVAAAVVTPDLVGGYYAYPYYAREWDAGSPYYDLPYDRAEVDALGPFDYEQVEPLEPVE